MLCLFRLSDSDDVLAALYLAADILQKKPQEKNWKVKSYCCFCSLERDRTPQKCQQIHSCSKTTEEKWKKVHTKVMLAGPQMSQNCVVHASLLWYSIQVTLVMWHRVLFFLTVWRLFIGCTLYPPLFGREFRLQSWVPLKNFTLNEVFPLCRINIKFYAKYTTFLKN